MAAEDGFIALAFVLCFSIFLGQIIKEPQEAFCNFYYIYLFYNLQQRMGKKWVKNVFMIHETINLYDKYKFQAPLTY